MKNNIIKKYICKIICVQVYKLIGCKKEKEYYSIPIMNKNVLVHARAHILFSSQQTFILHSYLHTQKFRYTAFLLI